MKIIIDECLPKRVSGFFTEHKAWTVPQIGLGGSSDTLLQQFFESVADSIVL